MFDDANIITHFLRHGTIPSYLRVAISSHHYILSDTYGERYKLNGVKYEVGENYI